jgi:hypothetical protein
VVLRIDMALLGPMVVVAEKPAAGLLDVLGKAGAFPIIDATWAEAPNAIAEVQPAALLLADTGPAPDPRLLHAVIRRLENRGGPFMPILARVTRDRPAAIASALPVSADEPPARLIARLRSALRVRSLHATVLRRSGAATQPGRARAYPLPDLLTHATVLCVGRGRLYPTLAVAIGERVGLIGALSVETAARYLNSRDVEGIVIGDGLGLRVVDALLTALHEDARYRDLPVGVLGGAAADDDRLPNLIHIDGHPDRLVEWLLPYVRMQAFESHLQRLLKSLDSDGVVDPETGLLAGEAFWRDLERVVQEAGDGGSALSIARFSFEELDDRASIDAARLVSRLVRNIDFACREPDGAILVAFTETDLRSAHVVTRRLASVLKHTMLSPAPERTIRPMITLATLKATDDLGTLVARVGSYPKVAAGRRSA